MYFCTSSTWNASNLCYATSESPEGPFEWQGALIYSGFTSDTLKDTDVLDYVSEDYAKEHYINNNGGMEEYNYNECPNAIDPTTFYEMCIRDRLEAESRPLAGKFISIFALKSHSENNSKHV